ncbi:GEVED domain-containing protein [Chryseobacterium sp. RG1]|uniref:GEVED domain-containing protein n=1 Tax=Chryseobacterium tagetis TaxID=2801334 RepID=A0ABS8A7B4_9FLAO|nr:GEVED domain-containing protein [Chryseobacterium tagetis]MCA6069362.1 GEVED domain-containing protein [Chryseobacterium tagetis]
MKKIYLFFLALLLSIQNFAQQYQVAGTCTMTLGTNTYGPMYSTATSAATSRVAVIYPASQLTGVSGQALTGIYFKKITTGDMTGTPNLKVYLKETSSLDFGTAAIDWTTTATGATLVYDSNPVAASVGAAGWKQFIFSNNFTYSGAQNLMVLMEYTNTGNTVNTTWEYEYTSPCVVTTNSNTTKYINNTTGTLGTSLSSANYRRPFISFSHTSAAACTGAVTAGTPTATVSSACANVPFNLALTGATAGTGITYQWQSSPAGANTFTNIAGATSISYSVANQTAATDYRCVVTCTNGGSTQNSSIVAVGQNSGMACLNYCAAVSSGGTGTLINKVQFGSINNDSSTSQPTASPYYTYYPAATTTVTMGSTQNLSVTIGPSGTYSGAITSVWIDWNQDGTLSSTEHFYVGPGSGSAGIPSGTTVTIPVNIPVTAVPGITRMRIRTRGNANQNLPTDACTNFGSGETEDYNITVVAGTPCTGTPVTGTATATSTSACVGAPFDLTLTGYTIGGGITYQWYSSPAGAGTFTAIAGATSPIYTVASQTVATDYRCVVTCTNTSQSATSNTVSVGQNLPIQCYCTPTAGGTSTTYYINSIVTTGAWSNINYAASSYNAYVNSNMAALTSPGNNVNVSLAASVPTSTYFYRVWVDWNKDGVFSDPGELVLSNTTFASTLSGTIPVPAGTTLGDYRVRCSISWTGTVTPCGPAPYGNYVDFTLAVVAPPTCYPPTGLAVSGITGNSATISWVAPTPVPAGGYVYYISTSNVPPSTGGIPTTATSVSLPTTLLPNTTYYWWVQAVCSPTDSSYIIQGPTFMTTQIPAVLPYIQNFEATNDLGLLNGTQTNKWFHGSATGNTGKSIYISNDNGVTNAYTITSTSVVQAYRDIQIPLGTTLASFSFDWKADGQTTVDYLRVWLVPSTFMPTPGTQITATTGTPGAPGRVQVGQYNLNGTTWNAYSNPSLNLTNYAGSVMRLVFEWVNNAATGTQPPAAVDNILLRVCSTATPVVTVTPASITHNSATITWPQDPGGASYKLRYRPVGSTQWLPSTVGQDVAATLNPNQNVPISGLNPATLYEVEVAAVCNTVNVGAYSHNEFTTKCDPTPPNVTFTNITSTSAIINWSPLAVSATYEMQWRKVGGIWSQLIALPNPPSSTYLLPNLEPYTQYEVQVRSTCVNSTTPNPWSSLSRFTTERTCDIAPPGLTILELKPTSAKVQWDPYVGPDATGKYILRYRKVGIPGWTNVQVNSNIYTLTDLTELTKYEMEVANVCSGTPGNFTLPYYFTTPTVIYCQMGALNPSGEYISKVTVVPNGKPQMVNTSVASTYTDYTGVLPAQIELIQGSTNNQLTIDKVVTGDAGVVAWIDFNRNGEFDINERILVSGPNSAATATTTFSVPSDAFVSNADYMYVVMRVALMKGGIPVNCTNFDSGEVEDYTVRITKKSSSSLLNQTDILIYPNPVSTVLNVKNISKRANYKIYSAAGQLISSGIILNNKVDVHALINGMYVIDIQDGSTSVQKKFIKE